jgi:hypothetical protein
MTMIATGTYTVAADTLVTAHAVEYSGSPDGDPSNNSANETTLVVVP